ncbi:DUF3986 family protein [Priestia endophytica]|uniref:DUF3986 domain-containing protein n=1 Tax=Priestia endophytica DSM 13796 TaxID=1121089 RepID=A0A1I6BUG8_9BACI|nr:DUF3986 family protein [Priestia endophytica]KYG32977.1 hypothetical protein AZF06_22875 [Priestia endophytica]SFQ84560.1 Protein of unknown function [Priestia endophytica DSM 13796]
MSIYDPNLHLHIGYYDNGLDYEATAYKRKQGDAWDVFFNFAAYNISSSNQDKENYLEHEGFKIFSVRSKNLDYEDGAKKFEEWLLKNNIIQL